MGYELSILSDKPIGRISGSCIAFSHALIDDKAGAQGAPRSDVRPGSLQNLS
jgi:hypothetical protein